MTNVITASRLVRMLSAHIERYGDSEVKIYDDYVGAYKTITEAHISVTLGNSFVIECEKDDDFS